MDWREVVFKSTICWSIVTWPLGMNILSTGQVCITMFATILDANTIPGSYAKINEILLPNLMDNSYSMLGAILTRLSGNMEKPG